MSFILSCPRCKAGPDEACLKVVSGTFEAMGMPLHEDGFCTMDAKQFNTDEERVRCAVCEETFPLGEYLDDEVNDTMEQR